MKIQRKLIAFTLIFAFLFVCGGFVSLWSFRKADQDWKFYISDIVKRREILTEIFIEAGYGRGIHAFKNLVLRKNLSYANTALQTFEQAIGKINIYLNFKKIEKEEEQALLIFRKTLNNYKENINVAVHMIKQGKSSSEIDAKVKIDDVPAVTEMQNLYSHFKEREIKATLLLNQRRQTILYGLSTFFLVTVLICIWNAKTLALKMTKAISLLIQSSQKIASKDLNSTIDVKSGDEIEELGQYMNQMRVHLKTTIEKLERSNAQLESFAFIASHDLQEPLKKICLYSDLLEKENKSNMTNQSLSYVTKLKNLSAHMSQLIHDVLEYSRLKQNGLYKNVDIQKVIDDALKNLKQEIQKTNAQILMDKDLPQVLGISHHLTQLFENLIDNALKFHKKGIPPKIMIKAQLIDPQSVEVQISDEGIGFDMKHAKKIVKPFQKLHSQREYMGTGVGLAICKRIAEIHNSQLKIESEPGIGSTFSIALQKLPLEP